MADNIWDNSDADNDANNANNWSLGNVPTGTDVAVFDSATTSANCTLSGNITCQGVRFDNTYSGTVNANGNIWALGSSGLDCTGGGSATFVSGSANHTCSGVFDIRDMGTWTQGTGKWTLTGTGQSMFGSTTLIPNHVEVTGSYTVSTSTNAFRLKTLTVSGTLTVSFEMRLDDANCAIDLQTGGVISGSSLMWFRGSGSATVTLNGTTFAPGSLLFGGSCSPTVTGSLATIGCDVTWTPTAGSGHTFTWATNKTITGGLNYNTATRAVTVDMSTNNPNLIIQGNFETNASGLTYNKGTGTITLSGSSNQTLAISGLGQVEDLVIDKSAGRVTVTTNFASDTFTGTDGDFDIDGFTADIGGAVDINGNTGFRFDNGTNSSMANGGGTHGVFLVGQDGSGNLTLDGNGGQLLITDLNFDYDNTSTGTALSCDVNDSLGPAGLSGTGTDIDATDASNNEIGGTNTGWDFGGAVDTSKNLLLLGVG